MQNLNEHYVTSADGLIYDAGFPVEFDTVTIALTPGTAGVIAKGQVIDRVEDEGEISYAPHATSGDVFAIAADNESYDAAADEVTVPIIVSGNVKTSKIVTDVDLTDADVLRFRELGINLR
ncbi:MAG: hypothetical protein J5819_00200 [Eubacterium sp.]|nr:hypothetical protein [Eubacterium sp.]